jgi:hypothetical protein
VNGRPCIGGLKKATLMFVDFLSSAVQMWTQKASGAKRFIPHKVSKRAHWFPCISTVLPISCCRRGQCPLHLSSEKGHVEVSRLLVECKADVAARAVFQYGRINHKTPLKLAVGNNMSDVVAYLRGIGAPEWAVSHSTNYRNET